LASPGIAPIATSSVKKRNAVIRQRFGVTCVCKFCRRSESDWYRIFIPVVLRASNKMKQARVAATCGPCVVALLSKGNHP
jgi:hypothetical protein